MILSTVSNQLIISGLVTYIGASCYYFKQGGYFKPKEDIKRLDKSLTDKFLNIAHRGSGSFEGTENSIDGIQ